MLIIIIAIRIIVIDDLRRIRIGKRVFNKVISRIKQSEYYRVTRLYTPPVRLADRSNTAGLWWNIVNTVVQESFRIVSYKCERPTDRKSSFDAVYKYSVSKNPAQDNVPCKRSFSQTVFR